MRTSTIGLLGLMMATGCAAAPAATPIAVAPSTPASERLHPAITYRQMTGVGEHRFAAHVLEIDLTHPALAFRTTAADRSAGMEFTALRTTGYLDKVDAVAAVNASYFLPFAGGSPNGDDFYPHEGDPVNASGAVIADDAVVSPVETDLDLRVNAIICFRGLKIAIADGQVCPADYDQGVAAGPRLLAGGGRLSFLKYDYRYASTAQPRTAIGVSPDGRTGWIIVVDGRQKGYSEGASLDALSDLFLELGASEAINLDGGGSSAMAVAAPDGTPRLLSRPIHTGTPGRERPVANHIAIVPIAAKQ